MLIVKLCCLAALQLCRATLFLHWVEGESAFLSFGICSQTLPCLPFDANIWSQIKCSVPTVSSFSYIFHSAFDATLSWVNVLIQLVAICTSCEQEVSTSWTVNIMLTTYVCKYYQVEIFWKTIKIWKQTNPLRTVDGKSFLNHCIAEV